MMAGKRRIKEIQTIPTAEPFLLPGGKIGVVLVHGFTGSPKEMRKMAEALNQRGLTVLGLRLAGHATQPADMARTRWWDWLASVEDGMHLLSNSCSQVYFAGLSLGGVLCLTAAARNPPQGVIAMSTPFSVDGRVKYARAFALVMPWIKKENSASQDESEPGRHVEYPVYPSRSLAELNDAIRAMHQSLMRIKVPVLLINSKSDPTVPINHAAQIRALLANTQVEQVILEKSGHVITEDVEREAVFEATWQFIHKYNKKS